MKIDKIHYTVAILVLSLIAISLYLLYLIDTRGSERYQMRLQHEKEMFLLESEYDRQYKFTPLSDHHILIEGNKIHIDSLKNYVFDYE